MYKLYFNKYNKIVPVKIVDYDESRYNKNWFLTKKTFKDKATAIEWYNKSDAERKYDNTVSDKREKELSKRIDNTELTLESVIIEKELVK